MWSLFVCRMVSSIGLRNARAVNALTSASTKEFVSQDFLKCEKKFFPSFCLLNKIFASMHFSRINRG